MIMITSTLTGEGKSITSSNLAVAMANTGKNTILVDCDLRKGTTHSVFGIKQSPGVVDILKGKVSIAEALVDIGIPNLKILPRGSSLSNPSEILSSDNLSSFFETLKTNYDIAIIDTPPVLNLPDTIIIGKHADGVVMVVQMERTQRSDVMNAYKNLVQSNTKVLGFMLTNLRYYIPRYMYNHYYGQTYN
jgi:capsular exopolysaccharide synthesis family protein